MGKQLNKFIFKGGVKMRISREYLESFIGKKVKIIMFDNDICVGTLQKGSAKWYCIGNINFRLSHLKKIEEIE